jgi:RimJ/RimL family protein N-acetyltransferase
MTCFDSCRANDYLAAVSRLGYRKPAHQISRSYTDGILGEGVVGRHGAAVTVGDLVELAGCFDREVYDHISRRDESHVVEPAQCWIDGITSMHPPRFLAYQREAFKPLTPDAIVGAGTLEATRLTIDGSPVAISPIEHDDIETILGESWSADWVANTISLGEACPNAFGFVARLRDRIIGGVGCYAVYKSGVEIQIDTHADFRRRGVATELAKRMVVECGRRSLECHWDAMNAGSAALARTLGFVTERTYRCYELSARRSG